MKTFYQFMLNFRGEKKRTNLGRLAEWIFRDEGFPKHAETYNELSDYLEWMSPFVDAVATFDEAWKKYEQHIE